MANHNITLNGTDDGDDSSTNMIIHEGQDSPDESSDSAYEADTIIDSPTSTSSTLQLNLSEDSNDQNEVNDNDIDEDEVQMLEEPPAAAAHPIIIENFDETGFQLCAMHSFRHLHTSCSGCACQCKARIIGCKVVDTDTEDEDPEMAALLADYLEKDEEDEEKEDEDTELPALVADYVDKDKEDSGSDSETDTHIWIQN